MDAIEGLSREELLQLVLDLLQVNAEQQARIVRLEEEIARLRGAGSAAATAREVPEFVKQNRKPSSQPKPPRKRRPHGFARRREPPTRVIEHFPEHCSGCGRKLSGGWLHTSRQVIEIPIAPVEVIEHRIMARHCGVCQRREVARVDLSEEVVGQSRLGVRLMSLIGYLDTVCRLPLSGIKRLVSDLYHLPLSEGELVRILHTLAKAGAGEYADLLSAVRRSEVLHADETGAREDGLNGYVWSLSTPTLRYFHRSGSRGAAVIQTLLGYDPALLCARSARKLRQARQAAREREGEGSPPRFRGVLVSDFYNGYCWYGKSGHWHQRCLVHLDRDLDALKESFASDPDVGAWVGAVLKLIEQAKTMARQHRQEPARFALCLRRKRRQMFEQAMEALARPYVRSALPQRVLAQRLTQHLGELFVFVQHPDVPADNNAAERAIRGFVVQRKISGGTRSAAGSHTQAVLASLFATWTLRGLQTLEQCRKMLVRKPAFVPT